MKIGFADADPTVENAQSERPEALRTAAALFLMAFGFALLSVCLFRILSFKASSTPFFMLYVGFGMPIGASIAKRRMVSTTVSFAYVLRALIWFPFAFLLVPLVVSFAPDAFQDSWLVNENYASLGLWLQLGYLTLATSPFFLLWGGAEFIGYRVALETPRIRPVFYLLFAWALALALVVGYFAIPTFGWLRTVAIVPLTSMIGWWIHTPANGGGWLGRHKATVLASLVTVCSLIGYGETPYILASIPSGYWTTNGLLKGTQFTSQDRTRSIPEGGAARKPRLLTSFWGEHIHFDLVLSADRQMAFGIYDGALMWANALAEQVHLDDTKRVFEMISSGSDICIVGSGGGRQVSEALKAGAKRVVAVDLAGEVIDVLKNDFAWINDYAYVDPRVETYAMDGLSYMTRVAKDDDLFDLVMLPYTENVAAVLRSMFETGHRIHTVESFRVMASHLKPNGLLVVMKGLDRDRQLFGNYGNSLVAAGLNTYGFYDPSPNTARQWIAAASTFLLLGSKQPLSLELAKKYQGDVLVLEDFQKMPVAGEAIYNDSPWIAGMLGIFLQPRMLRAALAVISILTLVSICLVMLISMRTTGDGESRLSPVVLTLAGISIGINAVSLENGLIFWLIDNLMDTLVAFFVGAACFLLVWGFSSFVLRWWYAAVVGGVVGAAIALNAAHWSTGSSLVGLALMILSGGLCFPLLAVRFETRLLDLFIADAVGGLIGGLLGIWIPVLFGMRYFFEVLPWISVGSFAVVFIAAIYGGRQRPSYAATVR